MLHLSHVFFFTTLLTLHPSLTLADRVDCFQASPPVAKPDCQRVIHALNNRWQYPLENQPRTWGRTVQAIPFEAEALPEVWSLTPLPGPKPAPPPKCEFFVDNVQGREQAVDVYKLQALANAVRRILESCDFAHGESGRTTPGAGNTYVEVRFKAVDQVVGMGQEVVGGRNVTVVGLTEGVELQEEAVQPTLIERAWEA